MARITNLINKADALKQLNAALKKANAEYDKDSKAYVAAKAIYDKEIVAYNKAVVAAGIAHLKSVDTNKANQFSARYGSTFTHVDFNVNIGLKEPNLDKAQPHRTMIERIEKQIRSVSIMSGETFNASMLHDDFFNCL